MDSTSNAAHALKCELAGEVLRSSGELRLRVIGESMLPALRPGDLLMIQTAPDDHIVPGDMVLVLRDSRFVVHRLIERRRSRDRFEWITKGDAVPHNDPPVADSELLGRVTFIVRNGRLIAAAKLGASGRAVAGLVRRSVSAARALVGVHGIGHNSAEQVPPWPR